MGGGLSVLNDHTTKSEVTMYIGEIYRDVTLYRREVTYIWTGTKPKIIRMQRSEEVPGRIRKSYATGCITIVNIDSKSVNFEIDFTCYSKLNICGESELGTVIIEYTS